MNNYDYLQGGLPTKQIIIVNYPFSILNLKGGKLGGNMPLFTA